MRGWAEHGLGISRLPEFAVADGLTHGTLVRLDFPVPDLSPRLVWRADQESLPGMREVLYAAAPVIARFRQTGRNARNND